MTAVGPASVRERPYYTFLSHAHADKQIVDRIHDLLSKHAGMPVWYDSTSLAASASIATVLPDAIAQCRSMIVVDISEDNLNTCIEAGIARGAGTRMHLVAHGPPRRPPFMFRDLQVWHYDNDVEFLGLMHRILYPYRRRVLDYEL